ncbi:CBL-interacting serine/threonine-protein kinase 3 isoform X4 [Vigna radiata var. radiata]|uniref:non-specific serine/threonine protein kinase n=1 Tax=Vigna radiata var. radiata TaxID=3916 RepID=A0A3Q0ENJ5_VIGRR|nr:CBL-interacting serine/threonine-protein kinase 3 isoform X4 [Vigna radiata var. radiata]
MNGQKIKRRVGKYEVGRTIGEGTFAKVKFARNSETGEPVALKIIDKEKVLKYMQAEQIQREIATMKLIKHPNVVQLYEEQINFDSNVADGKSDQLCYELNLLAYVMGSKTKIYIILEFVTGGELFHKILNSGRMSEKEARRYFQQLINAVDYCHSRGVYHRDLKLENLLLDAFGNLKISDFGLSALSQQVRDDGLLHTTCGTPNYVAPEVLKDGGYDGAAADLWSCGVILFVLLAGYLPFDDTNLLNLFQLRITISEIMHDEWFKKEYKLPVFEETKERNTDDIGAICKDCEVHNVREKEDQPTPMNAFELISLSEGLNLENLFDVDQGFKREIRFTSKCSANEIINKIEEAAKPLGFDVQKKNFKMKLKNVKAGRKGNLNVATEIFQVAPSLHVVKINKAKGDTLEFLKFYNKLSTRLEDVVWKTEDDMDDAK